VIIKFGVAGFRGIGRYQEIDLAPITIVTGPNSAGKSSLLEALRVSRNLLRTLDHETLIGAPSHPGSGRLHPEYIFGGDATVHTQFLLTPDRTRDTALQYSGTPDEQRGISIRMTIAPVEGSGDPPLVSTTLQLFNEQGPILDYRSWHGKLRLHWDHPLFDEWLSEVRSTLRARAAQQDERLVEPALVYFQRGFESASTFVWQEPADADLGYGVIIDSEGPDKSYREDLDAGIVGEFALCEISLMSKAHANIVRDVVDVIGLDEAIRLTFELEHERWRESPVVDPKLDPDLFDHFRDAVRDLDLDARADYSNLVTQGELRLQRIRSEVLRSVPHVAHVSASRGTPPGIIVEPPTRKRGPLYEERSVKLQARVNAWLGSDKLGTGYRYVREPLLPASHAQAHLASDTMPDPQATRIYQQYLVDLATGMRLSFDDVGYGVAQVLPVLLQLYGRDRTSIHVEQPESHLHPALQADLADAAIVSATGLNNQVALETHSEHLILRLLRRIRETTEQRAPTELTLTPDDVAIYYLAPGPHGATVTRIHISEDGEFTTPWPTGFFPERLQELG
jgi:hypothetical protein